MSLGRDTGTAGGSSGITWIRPPLRGFTKGWLPPPRSVGDLTDTQNTRLQFKSGHHSQRTHCLLCPVQSPQRKSRGRMVGYLSRRSKCQGLFFYLFLSLKEVQMSPQCELFKSLLRLLFAEGWMNGIIPPLYATRGRDSVWTPCESDSIRRQGPEGPELSGFYTTIKQSKTRSWESDVFYIRVFCMSCCGEHILSLFISDLTSHFSQPPPPYRLRVQL